MSPFLDRPIEQAAENGEIAVHGCVFDGFLAVAFLPVLTDRARRDVAHPQVRKERQKVVQTVQGMGFGHAVCDETRRERADRHIRVPLRHSLTNVVQLVAELPRNDFRFAAVGGTGGLRVTDAVHPHVIPPDVAAFHERHGHFPPFRCCWRIQAMTCLR